MTFDNNTSTFRESMDSVAQYVFMRDTTIYSAFFFGTQYGGKIILLNHK